MTVLAIPDQLYDRIGKASAMVLAKAVPSLVDRDLAKEDYKKTLY